MSLTAASNIASLRAITQVGRTTQQLSSTFERLSSGLRINKASDDPAGLAVADALRASTRIASVAIRNANDGISIAALADGALSEIGNMLNRLAELATQSANGVFTTTQRSALSSEFLALGSEIDRIAKTTTFNSINLLSNSSSISLQVGFDASSNSQITYTGVLGTLFSLGIGNQAGALTFSITGVSVLDGQSAAQNALTAVNAAIVSLSNVRGVVGATQSRLSSAVNFLQVARENFAAAESRIRDSDVATDTAQLVRLQILQQAGTAILAQANQQPQLVLKLLG